MTDAQLPENIALIEQLKNLIHVIDTSMTGPHMEYMATYDTFITFKEDGVVCCLDFLDMPSFIEAWRRTLII